MDSPLPLRERYRQELVVRALAERTVAAYVRAVVQMVARTGRHPARMSEADVRAYLASLVETHGCAESMYRQHATGLSPLLRLGTRTDGVGATGVPFPPLLKVWRSAGFVKPGSRPAAMPQGGEAGSRVRVGSPHEADPLRLVTWVRSGNVYWVARMAE